MEDLVERINELDINFKNTDYFEIEFCSEKCCKDTGDWKLKKDEEKCFTECFSKLAQSAILINGIVKRSVFKSFMELQMREENGKE